MLSISAKKNFADFGAAFDADNNFVALIVRGICDNIFSGGVISYQEMRFAWNVLFV